MNILNTLTLGQWLALAAVPPLIIALYFLKLKRQPLEVPSTYLWSRTIEDLHVNSIWQRLRQSLLLFLQLLLIALIMLACLRPGWRGTKLTGDRFIFLIDTSASMSATDVKPTRLEAAKEQVNSLIAQMGSDDAAMIISFSDTAQVEKSFTNSRSALRQKVDQIKPTSRTSDLNEALRAAAGLANPGRTSDEDNINDVQVADALPATLYMFTDGGFSAVSDFSLGNLEPKYIPIGQVEPRNVGIVAFTADRNPEKPEKMQAFARLQNSGSEEVVVDVSLFLNGILVDAVEATIAANDSRGVDFSLDEIEKGNLRVEIDIDDDLKLDNVAYTAVNPPRQARILFISPGNEWFEWALDTEEVLSVAKIEIAEPTILADKDHQALTATGYYDLIIYDRCAPEKMPQSNTFFIGKLPPLDTWSAGEKEVAPLFVDIDRAHPIMQFIDLGNVTVLEGFSVEPPAGGTDLIETDIGSLLSIGPRDGYEDAVMGFEIFGEDENGDVQAKTDWAKRRSFPVFAMNVVSYLGGIATASATPTVKPGEPIVLRTSLPVDEITVQRPNQESTDIPRETQNAFVFTDTLQLGVYDVFDGTGRDPTQHFSVNLFDPRESDLRPREKIEIRHEEVAGSVGMEPSRKEMWKWILVLGIFVLVFEWYVYNRRVYF